MSSKDEKSIGAGVEVTDTNIVDFDGEDDPANPLNWPKRLKWFLVILVSLLTTIITLATLICTPAVPEILATFHSTNSYDSVILVSVWELGEIFGPFIVAPLSELYGKLPVWHVANSFFIVFSVATAVSSNLNMVIAFRFLNGVASPYVLGSAIIGDLFAAEERGTGMSIATLMPIIGPAIGPVIGGYISRAFGWRWAFWFVAIATGVVECLLVLFMRETYVVKILETKTRRLRKETGNEALTSKYDKGVSAKDLLLQTFMRPMKILVLSPIVTLLSLYLAVVYGYLYIILTTITEVLEDTYHFSETSAGLAFLGIGLGLASGAILCKFTLDRFVKLQAAKGKAKPEVRLKVMILGGLVLPAGLFVYGWTTEYGVQWIVPILATALIGFGSMITLIPTQTYLVDAFTLHAASAIAAGGIFRSITGAVLPLAGPPLYKALGLGWGNSLLGFIALAIIPVPVLFCRYGEYMRERFPLKL